MCLPQVPVKPMILAKHMHEREEHCHLTHSCCSVLHCMIMARMLHVFIQA